MEIQHQKHQSRISQSFAYTRKIVQSLMCCPILRNRSISEGAENCKLSSIKSTTKVKMVRNSNLISIFCIAIGFSSIAIASAFVGPTATSPHHVVRTRSGPAATVPCQFLEQRRGLNCKETTRLYNKISEFFTPYESKIPEELREEIYQAEANTQAARDRGTRVALYALVAFIGIGLASFNGFLTDMRDKETALAMADAATSIPDTGNNLYILEQNGFGWVVSNPITKFFFTNKIGGIITLLVGGGSAILAEAEYDGKRRNAEKIYEELERRREQKMKGNKKKKNKGKKKRQSGKEKKRIAAISEVIMEDAPDTTAETATKMPAPGIPVMPEAGSVDDSANDESSLEEKTESEEDKGVFGKMKELYEKADSMAASQALIMNKNLEDAGVIEKITDESGLKVIGREEAKKLEEKQSSDETK